MVLEDLENKYIKHLPGAHNQKLHGANQIRTAEYDDWLDTLEDLETKYEKHLPGQHNQSRHAGKGKATIGEEAEITPGIFGRPITNPAYPNNTTCILTKLNKGTILPNNSRLVYNTRTHEMLFSVLSHHGVQTAIADWSVADEEASVRFVCYDLRGNNVLKNPIYLLADIEEAGVFPYNGADLDNDEKQLAADNIYRADDKLTALGLDKDYQLHVLDRRSNKPVIRLKHLAGQHDQQRHAGAYVSSAANNKSFGYGDRPALDSQFLTYAKTQPGEVDLRAAPHCVKCSGAVTLNEGIELFSRKLGVDINLVNYDVLPYQYLQERYVSETGRQPTMGQGNGYCHTDKLGKSSVYMDNSCEDAEVLLHELAHAALANRLQTEDTYNAVVELAQDAYDNNRVVSQYAIGYDANEDQALIDPHEFIAESALAYMFNPKLTSERFPESAQAVRMLLNLPTTKAFVEADAIAFPYGQMPVYLKAGQVIKHLPGQYNQKKHAGITNHGYNTEELGEHADEEIYNDGVHSYTGREMVDLLSASLQKHRGGLYERAANTMLESAIDFTDSGDQFAFFPTDETLLNEQSDILDEVTNKTSMGALHGTLSVSGDSILKNGFNAGTYVLRYDAARFEDWVEDLRGVNFAVALGHAADAGLLQDPESLRMDLFRVDVPLSLPKHRDPEMHTGSFILDEHLPPTAILEAKRYKLTPDICARIRKFQPPVAELQKVAGDKPARDALMEDWSDKIYYENGHAVELAKELVEEKILKSLPGFNGIVVSVYSLNAALQKHLPGVHNQKLHAAKHKVSDYSRKEIHSSLAGVRQRLIMKMGRHFDPTDQSKLMVDFDSAAGVVLLLGETNTDLDDKGLKLVAKEVAESLATYAVSLDKRNKWPEDSSYGVNVRRINAGKAEYTVRFDANSYVLPNMLAGDEHDNKEFGPITTRNLNNVWYDNVDMAKPVAFEPVAQVAPKQNNPAYDDWDDVIGKHLPGGHNQKLHASKVQSITDILGAGNIISYDEHELNLHSTVTGKREPYVRTEVHMFGVVTVDQLAAIRVNMYRLRKQLKYAPGWVDVTGSGDPKANRSMVTVDVYKPLYEAMKFFAGGASSLPVSAESLTPKKPTQQTAEYPDWAEIDKHLPGRHNQKKHAHLYATQLLDIDGRTVPFITNLMREVPGVQTVEDLAGAFQVNAHDFVKIIVTVEDFDRDQKPLEKFVNALSAEGEARGFSPDDMTAAVSLDAHDTEKNEYGMYVYQPYYLKLVTEPNIGRHPIPDLAPIKPVQGKPEYDDWQAELAEKHLPGAHNQKLHAGIVRRHPLTKALRDELADIRRQIIVHIRGGTSQEVSDNELSDVKIKYDPAEDVIFISGKLRDVTKEELKYRTIQARNELIDFAYASASVSPWPTGEAAVQITNYVAGSNDNVYYTICLQDTDMVPLMKLKNQHDAAIGWEITDTDRVFSNIYYGKDPMVFAEPTAPIPPKQETAEYDDWDTVLEEKHLPGLHNQSSHAPNLKANEVTTGRGHVYEIDALNTGEEYLAARNDIQKNWEGYNREIGVYAVDSISAIEHGRPLGWVLRDKGELVGVAAISEPDKNYPFIYIGSIAAKRTGYGTVLMKQIAGLAVEYNKEIRLASTNPDADAFYEAIGMVSIGDREPGRGRPYVMPKEKVAELANYRGA